MRAGKQAKAEVWAGFNLGFPNGAEVAGLDFNIIPSQGVNLRGARTQDLRVLNAQGIPGSEGNWSATIDDTAHVWTPCNVDGNQWVQLKAWAHLDARRASDKHPAIIAMQRQSFGMGWGWIFEQCGTTPPQQQQQQQQQQQKG